MTDQSIAALMAQIAALTERVEGMRADLAKLDQRVEKVSDLLARARGATWLLGVLAVAGTLFNLDAIRGLFK